MTSAALTSSRDAPLSLCGRGWTGYVVPASPEVHEDKDHLSG
jgi:hypothetical protein